MHSLGLSALSKLPPPLPAADSGAGTDETAHTSPLLSSPSQLEHISSPPAVSVRTPDAHSLPASPVSSSSSSEPLSPPSPSSSSPPSASPELAVSSAPPAVPVRPSRPVLSHTTPSSPSPPLAPLLDIAALPVVPSLPARPVGATHRITASSGAVLTRHQPSTALTSNPSPAQSSAIVHVPPPPGRASAGKWSSPASPSGGLSLASFPLPRQLYATLSGSGLPQLSDEADERTQLSRSATLREIKPHARVAFPAAAAEAPTDTSAIISQPSSVPLEPPQPASPYAALPSLFPSSSRVRVACELADTERTYVSSLRVLVRLFIEPLSSAASADKRAKGPLSAEQVSVLFSNAKLIFSLNDSFHHSLSARLVEWLSQHEAAHKVGDVLAQFAPYFKLYSQYCSTFDASQRLLADLEQNNAAFQAYTDRIARKSGHKFHSLASLLIQPIQRVPRYKLLLEQLLKCTAPPHPDLPLLTAALTQIGVTASHINESVRRREAMDAMVAIEERFMSSPGFVHASRVFLRQATLTRVGKSGAARLEHFFLFNDMLASARSVVGRYVLKKKIPIDSHFSLGSEYATQHAANAPPTRHGLLLLYRDGGCLSLYFQQAAEKETWLADIDRCIAQAANSIPVQAADKERDREQSQPAQTAQQEAGSGQFYEGERERAAAKERYDEEKEGAATGAAGSSSSPGERLCALCSTPFTLFNRRHSCRQCGRSVCGDCSRSRLILNKAEERRPERVCDGCALSADPTHRPAASSPTAAGTAGTGSVGSPVVQPSSPSASRSLSSRLADAGHRFTASGSTTLPALLDVPDRAPHTSSAVQSAPAPSSDSAPLVDGRAAATSSQKQQRVAHARVASSSAALLIAALSEPSSCYPPMRQWDCATLLRWLCEPDIGFEQFVEGFARFHVDGATLLELTEDELRDEIGVKEQLHRKRLRKLIDRLGGEPTLPAAARPPPTPETASSGAAAQSQRVPNATPVASQPNDAVSAVSRPAAAAVALAFAPSSTLPNVVAQPPCSATSSRPPPLPLAYTLPAAITAAIIEVAQPSPSSPSGAGTTAPAMPKRAAPSVPQRQRTKAVSERVGGVAAERSNSRCDKCCSLSEVDGSKACHHAETSLSGSNRASVDDEMSSSAFDLSTTIMLSHSSSSSRRSSASSSVAETVPSGSRISSTIAQRAALFERASEMS